MDTTSEWESCAMLPGVDISVYIAIACCLWIYCLFEFDPVVTWSSWKLMDQSMSNGGLITSTHSPTQHHVDSSL